jgi:protein-S-isoprenylcysteine O-methyltransferase Ste14
LNPRAPWWKGQRGEWYVVVQGLLFALIIFGPRTVPGLPSWTSPFAEIASAVGAALALAGGALAVAGLLGLGRDNLTALPYPRDESTLVVSGPYRLVRNPIYSGLIFAAFGYALWVNGWLTLGYAALLFVFFDVKSRKEERWLAEKFPDYPAYQARVRKLIPWVY